MKKLHELTLGAAFALLALSACDNEALLPDAPQTNEPDNPDACVLAAKDFRWEGNESRTTLTIEEKVAKFSWTPGDQVGILPDAGAQVYFTIPEPEEGVELTDEQRRKASFDGGAWALKATSNYAAYYPFIKDFDLQRTAVPVDYTGQKQTGNNDVAHLGAYDYMGARPVQTNENSGGVTFDFDHVGALVLLKFTVPEAETKLNSVTLSAEGVNFITEGTYDLTSQEVFPITATETSATMTVGIDYTTTQANEEVTVYFMCAPVDLSGKMVNVSVAYGEGESAATLDLVAAGKNLEAANGYVLTAAMGNITDPAQSVKGDYAMKDGSFIKYDTDATLTDAQKANVAGIVFWTTADMNTAEGAQTPAKLTDDKIMNADFPNCTHGLIVSLKVVPLLLTWQGTYTKIESWQKYTPPYIPIDEGYKSIASNRGPFAPINYILGYQNTKVLKAYNESISNESGNTVRPVYFLGNLEIINPAPANTTGWFLPSAKELHMLCYKDVDDVWGEYGEDKLVTKTVVNASLEKVSGDLLGNNCYWSSSESEDRDGCAFYVRFCDASVSDYASKELIDNVRAVCAY